MMSHKFETPITSRRVTPPKQVIQTKQELQHSQTSLSLSLSHSLWYIAVITVMEPLLQTVNI